MHSPGINGEGELRGQPANPGSSGKWLLKRSLRVCVCVWCRLLLSLMPKVSVTAEGRYPVSLSCAFHGLCAVMV